MTIFVKLLAKTAAGQDPRLWTSLFPKHPSGELKWNNCVFTVNMDARNYDWLVVYEGLPKLPGESKTNRIEELACPRENTLFITTEPSSVRVEGPHFLRQFGHILSAKPKAVMRHPNQIHQTPPLRLYYGRPLVDITGEYLDYDTLMARDPLPKTKEFATVCSNKQMSHTVHAQRYKCVMALRERMSPDFHVFGRGIDPIDRKDSAMDGYRYHLAIENHQSPGHWTEKLSDAWLADCLPFYYGDPDYAKIFPEEAAIPIDIFDIDATERIIRHAIANKEYEKRLPAIRKARQRLLKKHNLIEAITEIVESRNSSTAEIKNNQHIYGRHIFRKKYPLKAISDALFRAYMSKTKHTIARFDI